MVKSCMVRMSIAKWGRGSVEKMLPSSEHSGAAATAATDDVQDDHQPPKSDKEFIDVTEETSEEVKKSEADQSNYQTSQVTPEEEKGETPLALQNEISCDDKVECVEEKGQVVENGDGEDLKENVKSEEASPLLEVEDKLISIGEEEKPHVQAENQIPQIILPQEEPETVEVIEPEPKEESKGESENDQAEKADTILDKLEVPASSLPLGEGEVAELLNNLQSLKTPEPDEVPSSTVKTSFVDFHLNEGPLEEQSDSDPEDDTEQPLGAQAIEDIQLISDLSNCTPSGVNPELAKIREEQVRQWLIFEQENPTEPADDPLSSSLCSGSIEVDSLVDAQPLLENGEQEEPQDGSELMVNGVDGMPRRVRFLTDQEGNLLISVFMSNTPTTPLSDDNSILSNGVGETETETGVVSPSLIISPPSLDPVENALSPASVTALIPAPDPPKDPPLEKPPPPPNQEEVDDDACNSSDETLSVSSCNSMIEVTPSSNPASLEPEVSKNQEDLNLSFQLEPEAIQNEEAIPEEETASDASSSQPPSFIVHEPIDQPEAVEDAPIPLAQLPNIDENNNVVDSTQKELQSSPELPELRQGSQCSDLSSGDDEHLNPSSEIPTDSIPKAFQAGISNVNEPEDQQMVSLCIQEEHISAVALTIAKWESLSKAQSTENLSTSPVSGHAPVTKTSSSPCPCPMNKPHKPLMVSLSAKPVQPGPHPPIHVQTVIINESSRVSSPNNKEKNLNELIDVPKAPGWNCWGSKVTDVHHPKEMKQNGEDDIIYAQPNNQAGSVMTSITNPSAILKSYPKPLSKGEIINWLKEGEIHRAGLLLNLGTGQNYMPIGKDNVNPVIVNWFFGLISRQQAEKYLHGQPSGTFLVRISTRIWGYTLSYQASSGRTKHFLISATNPAVPATLQKIEEASPLPKQTGKQQRMSPFLPQGRYAFIGTNMTPYGSLTSLIRHYSHAPITKLGGEKLICVCPGGPHVAGMEYLFK